MRRAAKRDRRIVLDFECDHCGTKCHRRATVGGANFCSIECRSEAYAGEGNPNFKGKTKKCKQCGANFKFIADERKFCSRACYHESRQRPETPKAIKISVKSKKKKIKVTYFLCCDLCGKRKKVSPSVIKRGRRYCSYQCNLDDGGARKAGLAAAEAIMKKYGVKKDANHKPVIEMIQQFVAVCDLSHAGYGVPDGIAFIQGNWQLFDIKNPETSYGKRGLNKVQKKWIADWRGGPVYLIYTVEEAEQFAKGNFKGLKCVQSGWTEAAE